MSLFACCFGGNGKGVKDEVDLQIQEQLKQAALQDKLKFKVLLLGSGESGKSTVLRQLKLIHKINPSSKEVREYAYGLKRNALESMIVLINQAQAFNYQLENGELIAKAEALLKIGSDAADEEITVQIADSIKTLWQSSVIQQTFARRNEFWILDSAEYYFENIERFVQDDFTPSEEDLVMARIMTTGIVTTEIANPPLQFVIVDVGGQRNERRKWIHCFDDVSAIIFVVNLAGYNSVLFEDRNTNRMEECLNLFKQTVNNSVFASTPVFLVFNKKDLFEKLIKTTPINACPAFEDYEGSSDAMECLNYITAKFKSVAADSDDNRIKIVHIAARFKRDVKTTWDDMVSYLKKKNQKQIEQATKALGLAKEQN
ncbi:hypothetical protein MIR68_011355 [Amoeboaphelidium protococcarum]|nr:hypothetical protein MIR68_011355 [Amoeboaphelidium protococcarum]